VKLVDYDDDDDHHHHDLHNKKLRITRNIHSSKIFQIFLDCRNATEEFFICLLTVLLFKGLIFTYT
jgi:hypothetical protein